MAKLTGCGEVWYRAWFGSKRPRVRIPTLRPKIRYPHLRVPDLSLQYGRTRGLLVAIPERFPRKRRASGGIRLEQGLPCFGFESRHSDQNKGAAFAAPLFFICSSYEPEAFCLPNPSCLILLSLTFLSFSFSTCGGGRVHFMLMCVFSAYL